MELWNLFIAFVRVGVFGWGGGPSLIPLVEAEAVDKYQWLTTEDFTDMLAMGNALPGPIATKIAAYIGYKVAGFWGALTALIAIVLPTVIMMFVLARLYFNYKDSPRLSGMMTAVRPVVVALLATVVWDMGMKSIFSVPTVLIGFLAFVLMLTFKIHPAIVIVAALTYGAVFPGK